MSKTAPYTPEQATAAERLFILGWLETQRGVYERQAARDHFATSRATSEACLAVTKESIATLRAKWNMAAGG